MLLPAHAKMLEGSAISVDVIAARGYRSVTSRAEMARLGFGSSQRLVPSLLMPVWNVFGEISLYIHRPDTPRMKDGKPTKYEIPSGAKVAVDVHPLIREQVRDPSLPLFITEGTKKADAAISAGLCCLSLIGVWNWRGSNEWGGKTTLPDWDGVALKDSRNKPRRVYLVFDSDVVLKRPVQQALARLAEFLKARGADPAYVYLPTGRGGQKTGLDDYLAAGHSSDELLRLSSRTLREVPAGEEGFSEEDYAKNAEGLPWIETNRRHLRDITRDALGALVQKNEPPHLFVRSGKLVRLQIDENKRATLSEMNQAALGGMLGRSANFVSTSRQNGVSAIAPPPRVVEDVLAQPQWARLPPLVGVVTAPVVSEHGKLMTQPGYHPSARLFYHTTETAALKVLPSTPDNVAAAKRVIADLLADFPFADEASRAHAWALLLLPFVRPLIDGPTPLHLIDAPQAGTGKTLLGQAVSGVFLPGGANVKAPPSKDEEWSKLITSVLRGGTSHLLLDNVRALNSKEVFSALTSKVWEDRILGGNEMGVFQNRLIWIVSCNNIAGTDELVRRSIWIRLDAGVEQPDERRAFRHPDLHGYIKDHRPKLLSAVMTLLRSWLDAGMPHYSGALPPIGSFEAWTAVMGGLLEHLGIDGFLANRAALRSRADKETTAWSGFVDAWWEAHQSAAVTSGELMPLAVEWMAERLGDGQERSQKIRMGKLLSSHLDRIYGGRKVLAGGSMTTGPSKGSASYRLWDVKTPELPPIVRVEEDREVPAPKLLPPELRVSSHASLAVVADTFASEINANMDEINTHMGLSDDLEDNDGYEVLHDN